MSEPKTKPTTQNINDFINLIEPLEKQEDTSKLVEIFQLATKEKPVMWGTNIVGFGGTDWPAVAFSPRKQNFTLYIGASNADLKTLFGILGKHKVSGGCLYINKISDIDKTILKEIIKKAFVYKQTAK